MSSRTRMHNRSRGGLVIKTLGAIFVVALVMVTVTVAAGYSLAKSWLTDLPDYESASAFNVAQKTKIYASDGKTLLAELYLEDREPVESDQVCQYMKDATVAVEDERFYEHNGIDLFGIARAAFIDLITMSTAEGASTITQQFVRNTLLLDEMNEISLKRKVREAYIALQVEKTYTKDEILMMYLNTINYGDGAYGIESAARHYFNKHASKLTLPEAALIAAIPQAPTANNPLRNPETALERRNLVLRRMLSNQYITQEEYDEAVATDLNLNPPKNKRDDGIYKYPYFTSWVRRLLLNEYSSDEVFKGGLTVITTLDVDMQKAAEDVCYAKLDNLPSDVDISLTAIEPDTGYVKALFGGKNYNKDQFNLATQAERQAGSCFKMFTLVAAIENGVNPATPISASSPVEIGDWKVENYGGASYGTVSIQQATQMSSNTAYARLIDAVGADKVVDVAHRMGITSDLKPYNSLTLGAQGVNTLQMASAYGTLATGGVYHEPKFILKILDVDGNVLYNAEDHLEGVQAISPEVAYATTNVLKSVVTGGTATRARLPNQVSAGKTGTSQNFRDSMYCGYTPQLSCSVWIGARAERPVADNMGGSNCCPVWKNFMIRALEGYKTRDFPKANNPPYNNNIDLDKYKGDDEEEEEEEEDEPKKENKPAPKENDDTPTQPETPTEPDTPDPPNPDNPTPPDDGGGGGGEG